jgi:uncharacterized protein
MKKEELTKILIISGTLIIIAIILSLSFGRINSGTTISVQGTSTIKVIPDLVGIHFNIETSGKTSKEAKDLNSEILEKMKSNLLELEIKENEILTENFNIYQDYEWKNGERKENGYKASHSIKIEISFNETEKIGKVIDAGINAGAVISFLQFELTQNSQNEYKAEAMKLASQDAKIKAESTALGLNKKLGKLVSISVNDFRYYPWDVFDERAYGTSENFQEKTETILTNIQPEEQEISASVSAVFKLR